MEQASESKEEETQAVQRGLPRQMMLSRGSQEPLGANWPARDVICKLEALSFLHIWTLIVVFHFKRPTFV